MSVSKKLSSEKTFNDSLDYRAYLEDLYQLGIDSCHPRTVLKNALPKDAPKGKTIILSAGKAACEMASVALKHLVGKVEGAVVTRHGYGEGLDLGLLKVIKAGHPVPDESSILAAEVFIRIAESANKSDRVIFLISGGGSALLSCPADGLSAEEKREIVKRLVLSGAKISEINLVRKSLSKVKGGRLAKLAEPAELRSYIISDVVGDDPRDIASGPSIHSDSYPEQALELLRRYQVSVSKDAERAIKNNLVELDNTKHEINVVAKNSDALSAISSKLNADGWQTIMLGNELEGDARQTGAQHAKDILRFCQKPGLYALVSGGELTVTVKNEHGRGGPNLEYLGGLIESLDVSFPVYALAADSDGVDGSEDNAGAIVTDASLRAVGEKKLNLTEYLDKNCSYDFFKEIDSLLITGSSGTNVNDIRIILVDSRA